MDKEFSLGQKFVRFDKHLIRNSQENFVSVSIKVYPIDKLCFLVNYLALLQQEYSIECSCTVVSEYWTSLVFKWL
jgi:hypothetical protein